VISLPSERLLPPAVPEALHRLVAEGMTIAIGVLSVVGHLSAAVPSVAAVVLVLLTVIVTEAAITMAMTVEVVLPAAVAVAMIALVATMTIVTATGIGIEAVVLMIAEVVITLLLLVIAATTVTAVTALVVISAVVPLAVTVIAIVIETGIGIGIGTTGALLVAASIVTVRGIIDMTTAIGIGIGEAVSLDTSGFFVCVSVRFHRLISFFSFLVVVMCVCRRFRPRLVQPPSSQRHSSPTQGCRCASFRWPFRG
jgi:hypothetical protein